MVPMPVALYHPSLPMSICILRSFSSKSLKKSLSHVMWKESPLSKYHIDPSALDAMHAIKEIQVQIVRQGPVKNQISI
jgi:hypothetical protein